MFGAPNTNFPLYKLLPWYNGPYGIDGAESALGLRTEGRPVVLYVDDTHPRANDANWGTNPLAPKATVQSAVDSIFLVEGSLIVIAPTATVAESVVVANSRPEQCAIVGQGNPEWGPTWTSGTADEHALTLRQAGWTIANIRFNPPAEAAAICLDHDGATTASDRTQIVGNDFDGLWAGRYGIYFNGGPDQVFVKYNRFHELQNAGQASFAIYIANTGWANPYLWVVEGNQFFENDNNVGQVPAADRSFNVSLFKDNVFTQGVLNPTAIQLDLRGGSQGENTVVGNFFGGDYSQPGGYWPHAVNPGSWVGNVAEDVGEGEVGDNGFTTLPPAP